MKKEYIYQPSGVCSRQIHFEIDDDVVTNVQFQAGCNGNLSGIGSLVEGMRAEDVIQRLKGIHCGQKGTSCPDQLARALADALQKNSTVQTGI